MQVDKIFPIIIAILNLLASIVYFYNLDYAKWIYWFACMIITLSIIIM